MDRILNELFGDDEPEVAPAMTPGGQTATTETGAATTDATTDAQRQARHEARQRRQRDPDVRRRRKEFIDRYSTGDPSEGFTTAEAVAHLREMREELSPSEFRRAMRRTLENLPADQRDAVIAMMRQQQSGPSAAGTGTASGAAATAGTGTGADRFGGLLTGLMGGQADVRDVGVGDVLDDLATGGLRSPASSPGAPATEADFQALLDSPLARAVLGGVAAYGMQGMEDEDDRDGASRTSAPT